jgi:basic amino acid/polyamine antiporter, APA family
MRVDSSEQGEGGKLARQLTFFDAVMIVVSGTIGASIFIIPADVLRAVPNPLAALLLWVVAGGITLMAGLACAELGGMFPEAGGQYIFIREAYGRFAAFLYGWVLFTAGNSGGLAAMAISAALFLGRVFPAISMERLIFAHTALGVHWELSRGSVVAVAVVIVLTGVNLRSVRMAARLQNVTALAYLGAVVGIVAVGFLFGHGSWVHFVPAPGAGISSISLKGVGIAMIALLWSYDGWEFVSWVAGEIKNPHRNLPLALMSGIVMIIVTYLLANALFIYALPPARLSQETSLTDAVLTALFSRSAGTWVSLFIALICFGAASVVVLGGARIYYSMACDGVFFQGMKRVHPQWKTPVTSLLAQCVWVIVLILSGRYEQLYTCFVFMMTLTYLLTVGAVFVLRKTQPDRPRPYLCAGYPWLPIIYMVVASVFVLSTLMARPRESLAGLGLASLGIPLYMYWRRAQLRQVPELVLTPSEALTDEVGRHRRD